MRRPGFQFAQTTRGGAPGRVIKFDFSQSTAVTFEFTDAFVRFRSGVTLITTNDPTTVSDVSAANPAVVQTASAHGWTTGNTVIFDNPGPAALLENRQLTITVIDTTHFSLADALTAATIDGATLGAITTGTTIRRVHELSTSYVGAAWQTLRSVQAETTAILLTGSVAPRSLTVATVPTTGVNAQFAIDQMVFNDGPYLDPFINGVQATPGATSGVVNLTLSFAAYDSNKAYRKGAFTTSSGVNYVSLIEQNIGNNPGSTPTLWQATSAGAAINGGRGFLGSDVGRLVRLFSEPGIWSPVTTYSQNQIVAYNPSGDPGAATYWQSLTGSNLNNAPGADLTNWKQIPQGAAVWTWGKITSLLNVINPQLAGSVNIGNLTQNGGLSAAFDGIFTKGLGNCARLQTSASGFFNPGQTFLFETFVGKNYGASPQQIASATVYPTVDEGFGKGIFTTANTTIAPQNLNFNYTLTLRASQTAPSSATDGTVLGSSGNISSSFSVSIISNDQVTAWKYVWIELLLTASVPGSTPATSYVLDCDIAQVSFPSPTGTTTSSGISVEILGPALLYTNPIVTWQLGAYSDTTGWPTCGVYHEGRLWLGGAIGNRFDACKSGGINGTTIDFAPTDAFGQVAGNNAISYTLDSDSVNPIFWMTANLQGIVIGTQAGEFLVQAPTSGPITPTNIAARRVTKVGCANIEPRRTEHTDIFVHRYNLKLMEYFPDAFSGKFSAPNLAEKAEHITQSGIAEIAYQQAATPTIWGRDNDGALFGISYKRDTLATSSAPTFTAWHRHALGSGRIIESLCVGPSIDGTLDSLTIVSNDTATNVRYIEVLTNVVTAKSDLISASYLDGAVAPSSWAATTSATPNARHGGITFNRLWHLNGKTVQVWAAGLDCGDPGEGNDYADFVVVNGSIFVPFGDGIKAGSGQGLFTYDLVQSFGESLPALIGFSYTSQGQTLRPVSPQESGARNGPALGKITRHHRYAMHLFRTRGLWVGGTFDQMYPANFRRANDQPLPITESYSNYWRDTLADDHNLDGFLSWQVTRPYPVNIISIGGFLATQDQ